MVLLLCGKGIFWLSFFSHAWLWIKNTGRDREFDFPSSVSFCAALIGLFVKPRFFAFHFVLRFRPAPPHSNHSIKLTSSPRMPPGKENDDWLTIFRSGMWRLFYKLSTEGKIRFYKEFLPLLHDTAHEVLQPWGGEAWYLVYLGTKPSSRGKGYARKLLEWGVKEVRFLLFLDFS